MIEVVSHSDVSIETGGEEKEAVDSKEKGSLQSAEDIEFVNDACRAWVDELFSAGGCRGNSMTQEQLTVALKKEAFDWGLDQTVEAN